MPDEIPRDVRAFAFGLMEGVGETSYSYKAIAKMLWDRFGVEIAPKTLRNWNSDHEDQMKKYAITPGYIQEVIALGLSGNLKDKDNPGDTPKDASRDAPKDALGTIPETKDDKNKKDLSKDTIKELPKFSTLAEVVGYMEQQGFIVATNDQDLRNILDKNGLTLLEKGALKYGPEIISVEPIELDFEIVGKQIAGNPVIMWYYALARKLAIVTGAEPPELHEYVTGCVVDAMVARKWNMAVLRA